MCGECPQNPKSWAKSERGGFGGKVMLLILMVTFHPYLAWAHRVITLATSSVMGQLCRKLFTFWKACWPVYKKTQQYTYFLSPQIKIQKTKNHCMPPG